ncbi:MAG: hypothetical protein QOC77_896 [Thermoleophilaceae bacterium]|jgi:hypothetical protein|nr:hypothetical protein [Thermoleophilaceae bacterium]
MRVLRTTALVLVALVSVAPTSAGARARAPHLSWVKCISKCTDRLTVAPGGKVKVAGARLPRNGMVMFPVRRSNGIRSTRSMKPSSQSSTRIVVTVPANARSGRLYVKAPRGVRTNYSQTLRIRNLPKAGGTPPPPPGPVSGTAFDGNGMWIWYVNKANGGDPNAILAQAKAHGISTVFVKSGDGGSYWSQFAPGLVSALKAGGLRVCAWQYIYGDNPGAEAAVASRAVTQAGADCFVIDAEAEYEGRYAQARTYVTKLRAAVGAAYPIGLAAFPYVDYHPSFPYSVFLGPGGAQFNVPQAYWKEIGGGVDAVVAHTYRFNRPYGRTIAPLGQTYDSPPSSEIVRFRQLAAAAGASGVSWWSWQHTAAAGWNAVGQAIDPLATAPPSDYAVLAKGSKGDLVLWAQEHLKGAGQSVTVDGNFGSGTENAVKSFQAGAGLAATGKVDRATWQALLQHVPAAAKWTSGGSQPTSAKLPARRYEIRPGRGARSGSGWRATR